MYEKISGIYRIDCVVTGAFYIGSAVNIRERWKSHRVQLRRNQNKCRRLQNAWNKYGEESFSFSILEVVAKEEDLIPKEQEHIDRHWGGGKLLNVARYAGSTLGLKLSEEVRQKMSLARKGKPCWWAKGVRASDETRKKQSIYHLANPVRYWLGKRRSEDWKQRVSQKLKGRTFSEETRSKISAAKSQDQLGEDNPFYGRKHSPETIAKMSAARKAWHAKRMAMKTSA